MRNLQRPFAHASKPRFLSAESQPIQKPLDQAHEPEDISLTVPDFFNLYNSFTVKDLFDARVHYGHKEGSLNEHMKRYLYGSRMGHLIFDLDVTAEHLRQALNVTAHIAFHGGIILFFNRNPQTGHMVEKMASECGEYAHTRYWRGGSFTNSNVQFAAVTRLPDLCIFFNTLNDILRDHTAIVGAAKMNIPTIGIVDSNANPNLITWPVPGNDDSPTSIALYCKLFKGAVLAGKAKRKEVLENTKEE